jgi:hypothetical protein
VITNVITPPPPPGSISAIHVDHPHVDVPPITAPPSVILSPPQFSPNHTFSSISTVSIPSLPSPDTAQEIFQRLSTPDPYDFSTPSQPIHPVSPPQPMVSGFHSKHCARISYTRSLL